jgi:hypothetical protein
MTKDGAGLDIFGSNAALLSKSFVAIIAASNHRTAQDQPRKSA